MKFRKFGRVALALAASLVIVGTQSCNYDYTEGYIFVIGSQYNQVQTYHQDHETGYLYPGPFSPLSTAGNYPIRAVLLNGGRYLYVLNQGKPTTNPDGSISWTGGSIALFSIGGGGGLTYQTSYSSQGYGSLRLALSASGAYLYVLDEYQPGSSPNTTPASATLTPATPCYDSTASVYRPAGDITAFSIDSSTGRLFLVPNQQQQNSFGTPLNYFPVGCGAVDFHFQASYLYTAEASDPATGYTQVVYAYSASTTGQLIQVPSGAQPIGTSNVAVLGTSASGTYLYALDNGTNSIFTFTQGGNGLLSAISGGAVGNVPTATGMTALMTDSSSHFLYITNTLSTTLGQSGSVISSFVINGTSGDLTPFSDTTAANTSTFGTGATPVCIFEDPSHQFLYTAGAASNTITGAAIDPGTGILTNLRRGSSFSTIGTPTWCLESPNTD
jgi:6-phosphogluconolactonase